LINTTPFKLYHLTSAFLAYIQEMAAAFAENITHLLTVKLFHIIRNKGKDGTRESTAVDTPRALAGEYFLG
jgi:hypothetical protein